MKFILTALFYIIVMNAVMFIGANIAGSDFTFNFIINVVTPVICAYASYETKKRKERKVRAAR